MTFGYSFAFQGVKQMGIVILSQILISVVALHRIAREKQVFNLKGT